MNSCASKYRNNKRKECGVPGIHIKIKYHLPNKNGKVIGRPVEAFAQFTFSMEQTLRLYCVLLILLLNIPLLLFHLLYKI